MLLNSLINQLHQLSVYSSYIKCQKIILTKSDFSALLRDSNALLTNGRWRKTRPGTLAFYKSAVPFCGPLLTFSFTEMQRAERYRQMQFVVSKAAFGKAPASTNRELPN